MEHYVRNPAGEDPRPDPDTGLEESMWRLGLGGSRGSGRGSGRGGGDFAYPERPGETDCAYYLRTGTCGYGERCRYNHPRDRGAVGGEAFWPGPREYPERVGQPFCQYYMKTGTCKFGSSCKFHHPRQAASRQPVSLNYYGYPLRSGEKECSYYMKTGQCKFGSTCKFHHPQPVGDSAASPAPLFYPTVQPPSAPSPQQYTQAGGWQIGRPSSALTGAYMQGSYGPMVLSPGVVPVPGWSPYLQPSLGQSVSPSAQQSVQAGTLYGPATQLSPLAPAYPGPYPAVSSPVGPSSSTQKDHIFPERPGQPECQFYIRTGDCKFGATCKYHHPLDWRMPRTNCILSPMGLPLRPGAQVCTYYVQHGVCKFGPTCKFDHPMGTLSYSPSASSLLDMPVAPYPIGISPPTLAPSSSSTELRPEFLTGKDPFSIQAPSSEDTHSGPVSSLLTKGRFLPHSLMQSSSQMSAASSSSTKIISSS